MITKREFLEYCIEVRLLLKPVRLSLKPDTRTYQNYYNWVVSYPKRTLLETFKTVGCWDIYKVNFKYPELSQLLFLDLPDEAPSTLSYLDILEKL